MEKVYCNQCECWDNSTDQNAKSDEEGFCHFFVPAAHPAFFIAVFPKTLASHYCFQGIQKSKAKKEPK